MCLAPLYSATEMTIIKNFLCAKLATWCPYHFVWCMRPSGRNLGTFQSQVKISKGAEGGEINKNCRNFLKNNAMLMPFEIENVQNKLEEIYFMTESTISNICGDIV